MRKVWEIKKLGEVCDFQGGSQPPKSNFIFEPREGYVRFLQIRDFGSDKNITYIPESKKNRYCIEDDILLGRYGASVGKVLVNKSGAYNVAVMKTIPNENILNKRYLYFYLKSFDFQSRLLKTASRSAQDGFSKDDIFDFPILIPSLSEQQEIVSILDDACESIERAKSNAEQNLKNAKELFQSYLQGVFKNKGEDWEEKTLEEIADVEYGYTDKSNEEGDYRYIRITDIDKNGELIISDKKYINYSKEASNFLIQENDLLMARTGATFAKVLLYNGNEPSVFASYLIRIKFKVDIENELYWHFTKTPNYWDQANSLQSGAAQPHFNGAAVKQVVFPYPKSVLEQKKIIHSFQELSIETKKLEKLYQQKLNDLEELKKSILQKAFNGELKTSKISA
jgi:type I restriction enzyme S subunit